MKPRTHLYLLLSCMTSLYAFTGEYQARSDALPVEHFDNVTDTYLEGYIQALIDMHYYEYQVIVKVEGGKVFLSNLPNNALLCNSIVAFVKGLPNVNEVKVVNILSQEKISYRQTYEDRPQVAGIWFPQSTVIFPPLVASPRQPVNSINYRANDKVIGRSVASVSLGDDFPIFRWRNVFHWQGDLQIGIEAGIWSVFNYSDIPKRNDGQTCELVNTDYFVGVPLSYGFDKWSFRFRGYHISCHLGDELFVNKPRFLRCRKNPSFEAIDLYTSYQATQGIRLYAGPGYIIHSDRSFPMERWYLEYGAEFRFWGRKFYYHKLYGTTFFAVDCQNWQVRDWGMDYTLKLGYEFSKLQGVGRKFRIYVDYHHGYSYEGQFFLCKTSYEEIGLSWGF